jgi:hypothetical protein
MKPFWKSGLFLIAGPCVLSTLDESLEIGETLRDICQELEIPIVSKPLSIRRTARVFSPIVDREWTKGVPCSGRSAHD